MHLRIIHKTEKNKIARVFVGDFGEGRLAEFVESVPSPFNKKQKWVIIISTLFGCPVKCKMCDAGGEFKGRISQDQLFEQLDYLILRDFPERIIDVEKFKIQFARMGEPAYNHAVLDVIEKLPYKYDAPGLTVSLSTIAPEGTDHFFERLLDIRRKQFVKRDFQLQFSLHSTDESERNKIIPVKKWNFKKISTYSDSFYSKTNRKITLNFALSESSEFEPEKLHTHFDPEKFILKITPINPTEQAKKNNFHSLIINGKHNEALIEKLQNSGYEYIVSIGDLEENTIGSNCGQYISRLRTLSA